MHLTSPILIVARKWLHHQEGESWHIIQTVTVGVSEREQNRRTFPDPGQSSAMLDSEAARSYFGYLKGAVWPQLLHIREEEGETDFVNPVEVGAGTRATTFLLRAVFCFLAAGAK